MNDRDNRPEPIPRTCWMPDQSCPKCGGMTLATDGIRVWCTDRSCGHQRNVSMTPEEDAAQTQSLARGLRATGDPRLD
jgi:uncharacterized Zn finger protein (UPF0148 family)